MPIIKSAYKRMKVTEKKTRQNKRVRSRYKTAIQQFEEMVENGETEGLDQACREAVRQIDRAAAANVIHKNKAARLKSQVARKRNDLQEQMA